MNPALAYCGKCYETPGSGTAHQFFLTGCGQVFCQKCLGPQGICKKCGKKCSRLSITSPSVVHVFQDPGFKVNQLKQSLSFQSTRYNAFSNYSSARHVGLMKVLKERDSEVQRLENQLTEQENQIKLLKQAQDTFPVNLPNVDYNNIQQDFQSSFVTTAVNNAINHDQNCTEDNFLIKMGDNFSQDLFPRNNFGGRSSQRHSASSNLFYNERNPEPRSFLLKHPPSNKFLQFRR